MADPSPSKKQGAVLYSKSFGSVPPPREDLATGTVNLITNNAAKRPAILLNIQRGPNAVHPPRPTAPPKPPNPPAHAGYHGQPHPMGSYPPSSHPMGSYPPAPGWNHPAWSAPAWGSQPPWPGAQPSWPAPQPPLGSWAPPPGVPGPPATPGPWDFYNNWGGHSQPPSTLAEPPDKAPKLGGVLTSPAPPPPPDIAPPGEEAKDKPGYVAAKKGAVIYTTPRPPTPPRPKLVEAMAPHGPVEVAPLAGHQPPVVVPPLAPEPANPPTILDTLTNIEAAMKAPVEKEKHWTEHVAEAPVEHPGGLPGVLDQWLQLPTPPEDPGKPKKKQFYYDGEAWVYATEQPPMKKKKEEPVMEDVVTQAILKNVLENMEKGKYITGKVKDGRPGRQPSKVGPSNYWEPGTPPGWSGQLFVSPPLSLADPKVTVYRPLPCPHLLPGTALGVAWSSGHQATRPWS